MATPFTNDNMYQFDYGTIPGGQGICAIGENRNVTNKFLISRSSDGITWIDASSNPLLIDASSNPITSDNTHVLMKYGGTDGWLLSYTFHTSPPIATICKSPDGSAWTSTNIQVPSGYIDMRINKIIHTSSGWSLYGHYFDNNSNTTYISKDFILTSSNGITWIDILSNLFTRYYIGDSLTGYYKGLNVQEIEYGGNGYVVYGRQLSDDTTDNTFYDAPYSFFTSQDGSIWTKVSTNPFNSYTFGQMKYGKVKINGTLVSGWLAMGYDSSGTIFAGSQDGSTWTIISNKLFTNSRKLAWNGQYWSISAMNLGNDVYYGYFLTSPDGITWTESSNYPFLDGSYKIVYGSSKWWASGGQDAIKNLFFATSPDTNIWTMTSPNYINISNLPHPNNQGWPISATFVVTIIVPQTETLGTTVIGFQKTSSPKTFTFLGLGAPGNTISFSYDGKAFLQAYRPTIVYYSNKSNADANTNPIAASINDDNGYANYTLGNIDFGSLSGKTSWTLANTGQAESVFSNGHIFSVFEGSGFYKVYSLSDPITYYSNKANALANTNSIGSSTLPIIGSVTTGRTGGHTFWSIASNTASYPVSSQIYMTGFELAPGAFKLYPAAPPPPLMKVPPITLSYVYYLLPSVNAQMASLARFSANYATLVTLMTLLLRNIVAKPKPIGPTIAQKRQILSLASRFIAAATLNNNKTSYNLQLLNQAQLVVCQHILPASTASIQTIIQTLYAKYIGAEAPLVAVQDRAFKLIDLTKTVYARALLVNSAVIVIPTSSAAIVTANKTALTNLNTSVTALKSSLDSMNMAFLTVKGATRTGIQPNIVSATTSVIALAKL